MFVLTTYAPSTTLGERSVLVADVQGALSVATPDVAFDGVLAGRLRLLATRADLIDAGLRVSHRDRRLTGPVLEVCTAEAASLAASERRNPA
ncbi:hypothetical protein [Streptomyces sp. MP131-18]|uniref:hypothetical protein n=1 Tax=Streptomyces sp. MP131-18 TaxID=1857892 RepID=UPI00097BFF4A|nr:hypothetical protein [Streptomyces sp. MP131-18]ONK13241.1 hypothetical protein STBA_40040 [Streptomyces sp. MP131-18]